MLIWFSPRYCAIFFCLACLKLRTEKPLMDQNSALEEKVKSKSSFLSLRPPFFFSWECCQHHGCCMPLINFILLTLTHLCVVFVLRERQTMVEGQTFLALPPLCRWMEILWLTTSKGWLQLLKAGSIFYVVLTCVELLLDVSRERFGFV